MGLEEDIQKQLAHLMSLPKNWDSEDAVPTTKLAADKAFEVLNKVFVVPLFSGGCQLEWHIDGNYVEIEINQKGEISHVLAMSKEKLEEWRMKRER